MKLVLSLILSFVFLLWFVVSVVGMVYVSRSAELSWLVPVIVGQIFLVIGTAGLIAMLRAKKKGLWIDIVAMLVGAIIVVLPLIYHFGSEQTKTAITAHIPTLAGAGLLIAGLCGTLAAYIGQKRAAEKYSTPVEGICIERKTRLGSGGAVLHCPVYEITLNGETLRMEKEVYSNVGVPQIGESRTLYIDENDLGSYIEPIADKSARMIGYFISIPLMIAGIITLVLSML
ncbi:MAG: hypothetical protein IJ060_09870 [Oscillospiraceae bacterium]|nr:hypothetical protein [Oscillospiraceae bacterium]